MPQTGFTLMVSWDIRKGFIKFPLNGFHKYLFATSVGGYSRRGFVVDWISRERTILFFWSNRICLDGVDVHKKLFHVGMGCCNDRHKLKFLKNCGINFGWSKIMDYVKKLREQLFFKVFQGLSNKDFYINHIVLCETCCKYLEKLLRMLMVKYSK